MFGQHQSRHERRLRGDRARRGCRCACGRVAPRGLTPRIAAHIMTLRVYNTLSKKKELFEPVRPGKVGIYLCGMTVYKAPHIGHMIGPVIFDAIKRYLAYKGYEVTWVVNITDVDDKLIDAASKAGVAMSEMAERYSREYIDTLAVMGIDQIDRMPKATEHMAEIIEMVEKLIANNTAYAVEGNVYFDVSKDP